jgi:hypothetical protein
MIGIEIGLGARLGEAFERDLRAAQATAAPRVRASDALVVGRVVRVASGAKMLHGLIDHRATTVKVTLFGHGKSSIRVHVIPPMTRW